MRIGGTEISDIKIGSTDIKKVYAGSNLIWERVAAPLTSLYINAKDYNSIAGTLKTWPLVQDPNSFSGTVVHDETDGISDTERLNYNVSMEPGTYSLYVRSRYSTASSQDTTFVYINGVRFDCRTSATLNYSWWELNTGYDINNKQTFQLTGNDLIQLGDREAIYFDRIYITKNGDQPV